MLNLEDKLSTLMQQRVADWNRELAQRVERELNHLSSRLQDAETRTDRIETQQRTSVDDAMTQVCFLSKFFFPSSRPLTMRMAIDIDCARS